MGYTIEQLENHVDKKIRCVIRSSERGDIIVDDCILIYDEEVELYYLCQNIIRGSRLSKFKKGYKYSWKIRLEDPQACKIYDLQLLN